MKEAAEVRHGHRAVRKIPPHQPPDAITMPLYKVNKNTFSTLECHLFSIYCDQYILFILLSVTILIMQIGWLQSLYSKDVESLIMFNNSFQAGFC